MTQTLTSKQSMIALLSEFMKIKGNRFVSLTYENSRKETAKYFIMVGCDLRKLYEHDVKKLREYVCKNDLEREIVKGILDSLLESLATDFRNSKCTTKGATPEEDTFESINENLEYHKTLFNVNLKNCVLLSKEVIVKSPKPPVKHRPETIEKNKIKYGLNLKTTKIRKFTIDADMMKVSVNKRKFEIVIP